MLYAKSLLVGLCAAAVVLGVCWSAGLVTHIVYKPPPSAHPSLAPRSHDFVSTTWELVEIDVTTVRWYVGVLAGIALVSASGWQLRRSRGEREERT